MVHFATREEKCTDSKWFGIVRIETVWGGANRLNVFQFSLGRHTYSKRIPSAAHHRLNPRTLIDSRNPAK